MSESASKDNDGEMLLYESDDANPGTPYGFS